MITLIRRLHRDDRAALAVDYMLILLTFVFPIGMLVPVMMDMTQVYGLRVIEMIRIPFP